MYIFLTLWSYSNVSRQQVFPLAVCSSHQIKGSLDMPWICSKCCLVILCKPWRHTRSVISDVFTLCGQNNIHTLPTGSPSTTLKRELRRRINKWYSPLSLMDEGWSQPMHTHTHMHIRLYMYTHIHSHKDTHTYLSYTYTYAYTHTHIHKYTHHMHSAMISHNLSPVDISPCYGLPKPQHNGGGWTQSSSQSGWSVSWSHDPSLWQLWQQFEGGES